MQRTLTVLAHAKVNLTLDVLGRRPDGYHEVEMVMTPLALADTLEVEPAADLEVWVDRPDVPSGPDNLAYRAAAALRAAAGVQAGARIRIRKAIPAAAGLGGGSADAAATLRALNRLWGLDWPLDRLLELGTRLGADVPFCLLGRTALARGIGERLTPLPPAPPTPAVVATPAATWPGPKTASVYRAFVPAEVRRRPDTRAMQAALAAGDGAAVARLLANALEPAATRLNPVIGAVKEAMLAAGALGAVMAGAGPSVVALCATPEDAQRVAAAVAPRVPFVVVTSLLGQAGAGGV